MNYSQQYDDEDTYTITGGPLAPHEYVIIKAEMSAADRAWIMNHASKVVGSQKNPQMDLTPGDVNLAMLKRMIVAWHRTKTDKQSGQQAPIPLTEQAIERMSDRLASFVIAVINRLNPDTEEEDAAFLPSVNGSSGTNSTPMTLPSLKP